jgi:DNA polymerase elongation subunit (family B)
MAEIRRLFFDIETSPNEVWAFQIGYGINIHYNQIRKHAKIICISYKWEGQDKVYNLKWDTKQNEYQMLKKFIQIIDKADEIVGHNSDKFDIKWIRTRCMFHRLPMFPKYNSFDTLKFYRANNKQPSNRLNDIGDYFNLGHKIKNEDDLWNKVCFDNNRAALNRMVKYCNQDVLLLEKAYLLSKPYSLNKIHNTGIKSDCPECGSDNVKLWGFHYTPSGTKKQRCRCNDCKKSFVYTPKKLKK